MTYNHVSKKTMTNSLSSLTCLDSLCWNDVCSPHLVPLTNTWNITLLFSNPSKCLRNSGARAACICWAQVVQRGTGPCLRPHESWMCGADCLLRANWKSNELTDEPGPPVLVRKWFFNPSQQHYNLVSAVDLIDLAAHRVHALQPAVTINEIGLFNSCCFTISLILKIVSISFLFHFISYSLW